MVIGGELRYLDGLLLLNDNILGLTTTDTVKAHLKTNNLLINLDTDVLELELRIDLISKEIVYIDTTNDNITTHIVTTDNFKVIKQDGVVVDIKLLLYNEYVKLKDISIKDVFDIETVTEINHNFIAHMLSPLLVVNAH